MIHPFSRDGGPSRADNDAAHWMWRLDRGLTSEEQDAFFEWLAADPQNGDALTRQRQAWKRLDRIADWRPEHARRPNPDLLAPPSRPTWRRPFFMGALAAAAASIALVVAYFLLPLSRAVETDSEIAEVEPGDRRVLSDGSTVKINGDTEITVLFSKSERRVQLDHGEGFFMVATDPERPFIVEVSGVEVHAVGTAFNVRVQEESLDVLVAEGKVRVSSPDRKTKESSRDSKPLREFALLEASQRTTISFAAVEPTFIATLSRKDLQRELAWQHGPVSFDAKPLAEIVSELNLLNDRQLLIEDPELGAMRFSGTFRTDNVEGFVRLLEVGFGVRAEADGTEQIVLRAS